MDINADFDRRAAAHAVETPWQPSPMPGVERRMLDRIGGEVARATTIVRFAEGSQFSEHSHDGGEEYIVLEGTFEDDYGSFPTGTYVRNPPTTKHVPGAPQGCTIFVKLWQFDPDDRHQMRVDMNTVEMAADPARPGVEAAELFADARERVAKERWAPGAEVTVTAEGGAEILVLAGGFEDGAERFGRHDWLRLPIGATAVLKAGQEGAEVWTKTGHLRHVRLPNAA